MQGYDNSKINIEDSLFLDNYGFSRILGIYAEA